MSEILEHSDQLPERLRTRKRRDKPKGMLFWHHTRPLKTLRDILSEQGRIYRATVNGILTPQEGAQLMAQTREIRATQEAIITADAIIAANAPKPPNPSPPPMTINILSVPEGTSLDEASMQKLRENTDNFERTSLIEYNAIKEPASCEEPVAIEARTPEQAKLIATLEAMSAEELLAKLSNALVPQN